MTNSVTAIQGRDGLVSVRTRGDGPTAVLFVHGWMVSGAVFDPLLERLDVTGRTFVVPDQRGAGGSRQIASGYSLADYANDLLAVLDQKGIEKATIVGHSMGGQLALYLAAHHPSRVHAVAALCPVPPSGIPLPPDAQGLFRASAGDRGKQGTILNLACKQLDAAERERLLDDAGQVLPSCIEGAFDSWTQGGFADRMGDVTAPVFVLATDDPFLPPAFLKDAIVSKLRRGHLGVLPGPGHYPQCERPVETAAILEAFLAHV